MSLFADPPAYEVSPRFIRLRDAPRYLGMDKNRFNREVRPALTNLPIALPNAEASEFLVDMPNPTAFRET
jgi:hypothetical protein